MSNVTTRTPQGLRAQIDKVQNPWFKRALLVKLRHIADPSEFQEQWHRELEDQLDFVLDVEGAAIDFAWVQQLEGRPLRSGEEFDRMLQCDAYLFPDGPVRDRVRALLSEAKKVLARKVASEPDSELARLLRGIKFKAGFKFPLREVKP